MGSKQKYKVFINDQPVWFVSDADQCPATCRISLRHEDITTLKPGECLCVISDDVRECWKKFVASYDVLVAAGGVIWKGTPGDQLLMIYRLGKWDLPKGKLDTGESTTAAAIREVEEECGITGMQITQQLPDTWHMYFHKGAWKLKQTCWYEMVYNGIEVLKPQLEEHIQEARWFTPKELAFLLPGAYNSIRELLEGVVNLKNA
jgi:8-oxo-dGTP pyrophosphatase MutT (NUDIX family)